MSSSAVAVRGVPSPRTPPRRAARSNARAARSRASAASRGARPPPLAILACDDVGPRDAAPRFGSRAPVSSSARASRRAKRLPPARASPAGTRVLTSDDGAFDVSYGTVDQLPDISDTQARAFFEPVAPLVDRLLLQYFRADVSVTLDRKYAFLDSRRFAPLVAVERRPEGRWPGTAPFAAKPSKTGRRNALSNRDAAKKPGARPIVGVVELSIQRDEDVTSKLPVPGEASMGLPAATTPWADGAGEGGDLERWAARRAARRRSSPSNEKKKSPRAGRWLGGAPADEYAYVSCMCVKDEFRRRGCADALMAAAEEVTRRWGYDCAALHVYQKNEAAVRLYERRGYEIVDDRCGVVDKIMGKQRFLMVKRLR